MGEAPKKDRWAWLGSSWWQGFVFAVLCVFTVRAYLRGEEQVMIFIGVLIVILLLCQALAAWIIRGSSRG